MQTGIDLHDLLRQEMLRFLPMDVIIRTVGGLLARAADMVAVMEKDTGSP
ncbi:MAG: hypothetical protein OXD45_15155 [Rhodobacteraceae bacterium]|nr:hypothetical protein [Paracoccaceae bacterium]